MKIEMRKTEDVTPYDKNPRKNDHAVSAVVESLKAFGFRQPIVVDTAGVIIVGHTRWKAAQALGMAEVPVHVANLTPAQARAYRIADNQTATLADWNPELLTLELGELKALDFDLGPIGFDTTQLALIMGPTDGLTDPDAVPEPPGDAITQPGDLWMLGKHRLLAGDSSKTEDVDRLLGGAVIHLVNMDPPYNVALQPGTNNAARGWQADHTRKPILNDSLSDEEFARLLRVWFGNAARVLASGRSFYIWGGYTNCGKYPSALKECGLYFSQAIIWVKEWPVLTRKDFMGNHEWCFYGWKEGATHWFNPEITNATDVWSVKKVNPQAMVHLTEKPVELAVRAMTYSSRPGENVLDLFGGSGSTLVGAERTGRRAFLMEIDPRNCDIIVKRFEGYTGKKAERAKAERAKAKRRTTDRRGS